MIEVCWSEVRGSGPRSRSRKTTGIGSSAIAPMSVRRMSVNSMMPLLATPPASTSWNSSRSSGEEADGCRSSTISTSDMSFLAQWIAPMPMPSNATASAMPR